MLYRGWMDALFWSPDGTYLAYVYKPDIELLKKLGVNAEKEYKVIAICKISGGPIVWIASGIPSDGISFPSWGPVPQDNISTKQKMMG